MKFHTVADATSARSKALDAGRAIAKNAEAEGRMLTSAEREEVATHIGTAKAAAAAIPELEGDQKLRDEINSVHSLSGGGLGGKNYRASMLDVKGRLDTDGIAGAVGRKAVLESGSVVVPTPLLGSDIRRDGERPQLLAELLPSAEVPGDRFRYLRQTTRTNLAAAVARGDEKPTSVATLESVDERVRTIATLSEPINRVDLDDSAALSAFISAELRYNVLEALDDLVVSGDGTGETFKGMLELSGISSQAYDSSALTSIRKGITALQLLHLTPTHLALHPTDWEDLELVQSDQRYVLSDPGTGGSTLPVDRARAKVWGVQVVQSVAVPSGTGILFDRADLVLVIREGIRVDVSENVADDFARNLVRLRCEIRAALAPLRPASICEVDLNAGS